MSTSIYTRRTPAMYGTLKAVSYIRGIERHMDAAFAMQRINGTPVPTATAIRVAVEADNARRQPRRLRSFRRSS